mgnify:CR=1 FL=1
MAAHVPVQLSDVLLVAVDDGPADGAAAEEAKAAAGARRHLHRQAEAVPVAGGFLYVHPVFRPVDLPGARKHRLLQVEDFGGAQQDHPLAVQLQVVLVLFALGGVLAVRKRAQVLIA